MGERPPAGDRLVVVGSGTVVPEPDRGASCYWVEMGSSRLLLDCGPGAVQGLARRGLPWEALTDLVLSHFHADHVGALPGFFFALKHGIHPPRERTLRVWGPPGTRTLFEKLADALGEFLLDPGFPVEIRETPPGEATRPAAGLRLATRKTPHTEESRAIRLEAGGSSLGYTGDTGPASADLGAFFRGVEVLLCECSLPDEQVGDNHLSPSRAAELARVAGPGLLLLTHVYPHLRTGADPVALVRAAGYTGDVRLARDGLEVPLARASAPDPEI